MNTIDAINLNLYHVEAEESVLGGVIFDPDAISLVQELPPEAFYNESHKAIFKAVLNLHQQGKMTDLMTVTTELADRGLLEQIGGQSKLASLVDATVSALNIRQHAELIREKWERRQIVDIANRIAQSAQNPSEKVPQLIERSQALFLKLSVTNSLKEIEEDKKTCLRWLQEQRKGDSQSNEDSVRKAAEKVKGLLSGSITKEERLKLELLLWQGEIDPEKKAVLKADICQSYKLKDADFETLTDRSDRKEDKRELDLCIESQQKGIEIREILPPELANPLELLARNQNMRVECFATALLCAVSGLQKSHTKLEVNRALGWNSLSPNLFGAIVAESSQRKSPILQGIISEPLEALEREAKEEFEEAKAVWEKLELEYMSLDRDAKASRFPDGLPEQPSRRLFSVSAATGEGLRNQIERQKGKGFAWLADELAGMFKAQNQYRSGGKGSDQEDLLSFYDGRGSRILRASGVVAEFDRVAVSIFGGIQPKVFESLVGEGFEDSNGSWARFILVQQPISPLLNWPTGEINISPLLESIYRAIDEMPAKTYRFCKEAQKYFGQIYLATEQKRLKAALPAVRFSAGKLPGKIGKLALNLHILYAAIAGELPEEEIPLDTLKAAIKLGQFYQAQLEAIALELGGGLTTELNKVIGLARRKRTVSARDVQQSYSGRFRPKPEKIREWFKDLADMGFGTLSGEGRNLKFSIAPGETKPKPNIHTAEAAVENPAEVVEIARNVGCGERVGSASPTPKTQSPQGFSTDVGFVGASTARQAQPASDRPQVNAAPKQPIAHPSTQPDKFISFGWTTDELLKLQKTVTRRTWPEHYARTFKKGDIVAATDKSPRKGGEALALIRLTEDPYEEDLRSLTTKEVEAEGFPGWTPKRFVNQFFKGKQKVWVVRFEVLKVFKQEEQPQEINKNLNPFPAIGDWIVRKAHGVYQQMRCQVIDSNGEEAIAISEETGSRWNFTRHSWEEGLFFPF